MWNDGTVGLISMRERFDFGLNMSDVWVCHQEVNASSSEDVRSILEGLDFSDAAPKYSKVCLMDVYC